MYFLGEYIVRGLELEVKYIDIQDGETMDRFAWDIGPLRLKYPEIGEDITIRGPADGVNSLRHLWITSPSAQLHIDWNDDQHWDDGNQPEKFESNYYLDGKICSDEWWCWRVLDEQLGLIEEWALGKSQSLTINHVGELIWRCDVLQALEEDQSYPPVIETSWVCKATKVED